MITPNSDLAPPVPDPRRADGPLTVAQAGEHALIDRIRQRVPPPPPWVHIGIGDDAAVVEPARNTLDVITTDALVEGVHFNRRFVPPRAIGHKALAVTLSDLAAMGASPRVAVLSLALPDAFELTALDELVDGLLALARRAKIELVGGNITRSPGPLVVDVTAIGTVKRRRILTRGGARPGDELYVSGTIGAAAAGLQRLSGAADGLDRETRDGADPLLAECEARFLEPEPRLQLGALLGRNRAATACIDLSDGLADALHQLTRASGVGALVEEPALPVHAAARRWFDHRGQDPIDAALGGGEDYELLFTVSPKRRSRFAAVRRLVKGVGLTRIGLVTPDRSVSMRRDGRHVELPRGFAHFQ